MAAIFSRRACLRLSMSRKCLASRLAFATAVCRRRRRAARHTRVYAAVRRRAPPLREERVRASEQQRQRRRSDERCVGNAARAIGR